MNKANTIKSKLIIFDGIDGVGKSSQIELIGPHLQKLGYSVAITKNLGGTQIGEAIREVMLSGVARPPKTDLYLSVAAQEALVEEIFQLRFEVDFILMDRSPLSLAAYQMYGSGVDRQYVWPFVEEGMSSLAPDLSFLLVGNIQQSLERARNASETKDYFESKPLSYFEDVSAGFDEMAKVFGMNVINVDYGIEQANKNIMNQIREKFSI